MSKLPQHNSGIIAPKVHKEIVFGYSSGSSEGGDSINENSIKIVVAGNAGCGKTSIITRYVGGHFAPNEYEPTAGADYRVANNVVVQRNLIDLRIWDTAGNPATKNLGRKIYPGSDCLILVFDITSTQSFEAIDGLLTNFINYSGLTGNEVNSFPLIVVGNKADLTSGRRVTPEQVFKWCMSKRPPKVPHTKTITYLECSAIDNTGIKEIFKVAAEESYEFVFEVNNQDNDPESDEEDPRKSRQLITSSNLNKIDKNGNFRASPTPQQPQQKNGKSLTSQASDTARNPLNNSASDIPASELSKYMPTADSSQGPKKGKKSKKTKDGEDSNHKRSNRKEKEKETASNERPPPTKTPQNTPSAEQTTCYGRKTPQKPSTADQHKEQNCFTSFLGCLA